MYSILYVKRSGQMKAYGPLIRKIRMSKHYTQKEVYSGVASRSFYAKFEAGEYAIEAFKFKRILENMNMSEPEFFFLYDKENPATKRITIRDVIAIYYDFNLHSVDKLLVIYRDNKTSEISSDRLISSAAYALAWSLKPTIDHWPLVTLREYFTRLESFSMMELELFITTFFIFFDEEERIEPLLSKAIAAAITWWSLYPELIDRLIGALYVNMIQFLITNNELEKASLLDKKLTESFTDSTFSLTTQLYFTFFKAFLAEDRAEVTNILSLLRKNDRQTYTILSKIIQSTAFRKILDISS
ncbi:XRE family transcriptional regulator [Enterococcus gallinarum]|nr:XRE family transcriptional regulator [Enterococcus gallinarum]MBO6420651.1 XRE family transcriptional regulator [Enterococcus gallinarum]QCT90745.1 helix-turn-helix transcriptional regulator [Enterococcus sp. M190262]